MRYVVAIMAACIAAAPINAITAEVDGNVITLDAEDMAKCTTEGGCTLITSNALELFRQAAKVAKACGGTKK